MPRIRLNLVAAALFLAAPATAQTETEVTIGDYGGVIIPEAHRGQLLPDQFSPNRVVFSDELGWYRFTMKNSIDLTTSIDGTIRSFKFVELQEWDPGIPRLVTYSCEVMRLPGTKLSELTWSQIQTAISYDNSDYRSTYVQLRNFYLDDLISEEFEDNEIPGTALGPLALIFPGFPFEPVKVLNYHLTLRTTFTLVPSPVGALVLACQGDHGSLTERMIQRNLQIGSAMTSPP